MDTYGRNPRMEASQSNPPLEWSSPGAETGLEELMWQSRLGGRESYPERPGEPDCIYYTRNGFCGYGARCRFNHPRGRTMVVGAARPGGGEYPERVGQPVLAIDQCGIKESLQETFLYLDYLFYEKDYLQQGEKECSYYVKTGQCKFGATCKFHHPQPSDTSIPAPAPAFYPTVQSASVPSPQQYGGMHSSWQAARPALLPSLCVQGTYGPVLLSPGMVPVPGWSPFPAPVSPVVSPGSQPTVGAGSLYRVTQLSHLAPAYPGPYPPLPSSADPSSNSQKEHIFPERLGQPDCQYYLRTGDCKFKSTCRYHHPPVWITPKTNCALSHMGLPLRPVCCFFHAFIFEFGSLNLFLDNEVLDAIIANYEIQVTFTGKQSHTVVLVNEALVGKINKNENDELSNCFVIRDIMAMKEEKILDLQLQETDIVFATSIVRQIEFGGP
ncbi:hypothetical protein HHK36_012465 [Tetracentron sinense]|uniref:C3H1-type domain-containing protein n=1 Tax=Tetracentron sinense TaxID=13715 RepID=A0A834Z6W2_TETSI|nr:hypothetical protein HHK36_012465 [Tetracentron sinense]